jgi:hypothetical protein
LTLADGTQVICDVLVNASGLNAPLLARRIDGLDASALPQAYYCKGNYFTLAGRSPFSRLIYPVPEAAGLGVHLTIDLGGQAKFGPDVQWTDRADDLVVGAMCFTRPCVSTGRACPMGRFRLAMQACGPRSTRPTSPPPTSCCTVRRNTATTGW